MLNVPPKWTHFFIDTMMELVFLRFSRSQKRAPYAILYQYVKCTYFLYRGKQGWIESQFCSCSNNDILTPGSNFDSNYWGKNCINLEHNTPSLPHLQVSTSRCEKIEFSSARLWELAILQNKANLEMYNYVIEWCLNISLPTINLMS